MHSSVGERAEALGAEMFVGCPVEEFEPVGRLMLALLLEFGLQPQSKVLDVGCGCLRMGYWLLHFLEPGCYFGIEPNVDMLTAGRQRILEEGLEARARPRFARNNDFDLEVFGEVFEVVLASSIWTHASKPQIEAMLDSYVRVAHDDTVLLLTYHPSKMAAQDYQGKEWVGRSHESDRRGWVAHDRTWIDEMCARRGLAFTDIERRPWMRQIWATVTSQSATGGLSCQ